MPTLDDIEDLNGVLETGLAAGVYAALAQMPYTLAADFQRGTPRVEITVSINNATGARRAFADLRMTRFTRWNFTVKFLVVTRPAAALARQEGESDDAFRARQNANFQIHQQMAAKIRGYASAAAQNTWEDFENFPYHFIAEELRDASSLKKLKPDQGDNETALIFGGVIAVRESAWLALAPPAVNPPVPPPASAPILDDDGNQILDDDGNAVLSD
jgi:hypothetical protein